MPNYNSDGGIDYSDPMKISSSVESYLFLSRTFPRCSKQNNGRKWNKCNTGGCLQAYDVTLSPNVRASCEDITRSLVSSDSHTYGSRTRAYSEGQHQ